jgi:hypothetical protein
MQKLEKHTPKPEKTPLALTALTSKFEIKTEWPSGTEAEARSI